MVRSTIELEDKIRETDVLKGLERGLPAKHSRGSSETPDAWWAAVRRSVDRSLDTDRMEETLRLRQQQPGE